MIAQLQQDAIVHCRVYMGGEEGPKRLNHTPKEEVVGSTVLQHCGE